MVINIEVPVRVFAGGRLVTDLTIDDFELLEDGKPQRLEAVYFVKRHVERRSEAKRFAPHTSRKFSFSSRSAAMTPRWAKPWIISSTASSCPGTP